MKAILKVRFRFVLREFVPCEREPNPELHSRGSIYDAIAGKYNYSTRTFTDKIKIVEISKEITIVRSARRTSVFDAEYRRARSATGYKNIVMYMQVKQDRKERNKSGHAKRKKQRKYAGPVIYCPITAGV